MLCSPMDIKATVQVGKSGVTDGVVQEIKEQLEKRKVVKVKFMKNTDREGFKSRARELAELTNSDLVEVRGFTVILKKKGYRL